LSNTAEWRWVNGKVANGLPWISPQPDVGNSPLYGDFPAFGCIHIDNNKSVRLDDKSDTAYPEKHWLTKIIGYLVEWEL
jgi:hypothetical protein